MKLIDKLKNVFFEEVEEDEEELPQTFAKKVELPNKHPKIFHHEEDDEEEKEIKKEEIKREEKATDDKLDFELKPHDLMREKETKEPEKSFPMMFDVDDFLEDNQKEEKYEELPKVETREERMPVYRREKDDYEEDERELYHGKKEVSYSENITRPSYSYTKSYHEEKETKGFRPSPIISPIYGILDKNYHKEEVITKRETRITSTYKKPDLDSVRNKAFGGEENETETKRVEAKKVNAQEEKNLDNKRVYDVNSNKPQVNRVTLADADEYYNDLGLAYNVDYSDASRTNNTRTTKYNTREKKKEEKVDDNLFDLIDSMYNKED